MSRVAVIGAGYVGLTTAACLADLGNNVVVVDIDDKKIAELQRNRVPFYEPGINELVEFALANGDPLEQLAPTVKATIKAVLSSPQR